MNSFIFLLENVVYLANQGRYRLKELDQAYY